MSFGVGIAFLVENLDDAGLELSLDDDFAVLAGTAHSTPGLEQSREVLEVVLAARESADDGDGFSSPSVLLDA